MQHSGAQSADMAHDRIQARHNSDKLYGKCTRDQLKRPAVRAENEYYDGSGAQRSKQLKIHLDNRGGKTEKKKESRKRLSTTVREKNMLLVRTRRLLRPRRDLRPDSECAGAKYVEAHVFTKAANIKIPIAVELQAYQPCV